MRFNGIQNKGENNCFLNSILQILYFSISFHNSQFTTALIYNQSPISTLLQILQSLFSSYQKNKSLDPSELRSYLSEFYFEFNKFQLKEPADSLEVFLAILEIIHQDSGCSGENKNLCIAHELFSLKVFEQYQCLCQATSEILTWDTCTFSMNFYADEMVQITTPFEFLDLPDEEFLLCSEAVKVKGKMVERFLQQTQVSLVEMCPESNCSVKQSGRFIYVTSSSSNFVIALVWHKQPSSTQVCQMLSSVQLCIPELSISEGFPSALYLKSLVFYNKFHYFCYTFDQKWYKCDDNLVKPFQSYEDLLKDAISTGFWPVSLFYSTDSHEYQELSPSLIADLEKRCMLQEMLKSLENNQNFWTCECSALNPDFNLFCDFCLKSRFSEFYWSCDRCGHLNGELQKKCLNCQSFVLEPSQSSYHFKLSNFKQSKTFNFQKNLDVTRNSEIFGRGSQRFDKEKYQKIRQEEKKRENLDALVLRDVGRSLTGRFGKNYCKVCKSQGGDLCLKCSQKFSICSRCQGVFKTVEKQCGCRFLSKSQRFYHGNS